MNDTTTATALSAPAERRCWRCLQMFPTETAGGAPAPDQFWLCDPCQAVLLPSKGRAS